MPLFFNYSPQQAWEDDDGIYINFFLTEVKRVLPYFEVFPGMAGEIFSRAIADQALFQTILSVSHLIADSRQHRSLIPAFSHQQQALSLLQQSISSIDITEAVAISVAMLAWLNICRFNRPALSQHLHGLFLIFEEIQKRGTEPSPLLMQIWRFSIRMDLVASCFFFPRRPLFAPVPQGQDDFHRQWVRRSTSSNECAEWTLTWLALDNIMHRANHFASQARDLRKTGANVEPQIREYTRSLFSQHYEWVQRDTVRTAERREREENAEHIFDTSIKTGMFLNYPPLRVYNKFYANLLNAWRATWIYIDLIENPAIGPGSLGSQRRKYAVEICRTYAAIGRDTDMFPTGKVFGVFLSGVAFGGLRRSPAEVGWIYDHSLKDVKDAFPLNNTAVVSLSQYSIDQ